MSVDTQIRLAGSRWGRMLMHTVCLVSDHKLGWHWQGIYREIVGV